MLTLDQIRFIRLHQRYLVDKYQTLFGGATVRAWTERGATASVRLDELESLLAEGLLQRGWGGSFNLTEAGKAV